MLDFLELISRAIDRLNLVVGRLVSWVTLLVVLVVFTDVVMRYAFNTSFVFTQELEWHLFAFIFLMGAGYTLLREGHVRVDIIYQRLDRRGRAWVDLAGVVVFLLPGCYLVIATAIPFVVSSYLTGEGSPDPGGIPHRWLLKACVPAGFLLLGLQGISMAIKAIRVLAGRETD
ncbi:MAG TPA: TRAP transporter small permease subunit [Desulfobulbus sp.]|nr:TRAP transporter small permease subunit [Desulfobulbus sp.]